jgi:hypothetical protein
MELVKVVVKVMTSGNYLQFDVDSDHCVGLVFVTSQSLCLVRGEGRGWNEEKSSLDLTTIKPPTLSMGGQHLTP